MEPEQVYKSNFKRLTTIKDMISNKDDVLEANLIPAAVPTLTDIPHVITDQPSRNHNSALDEESKRTTHYYARRHQHHHHQSSKNPTGLARLSVAEQLLIQLDHACFRCNCNTKYVVRDVTSGIDDSVILKATEELSCCNFGSLRNVVIRDREGVPVARACFKEKHFLSSSLVLAVYSPPESLIGKVEEAQNCFMFSSKFILGNADGDNLFRIEYQGGLCSSYFTVKSIINNNEQVAKILEKTGTQIRLQFISKMSITNKIILVGFCLGMIHKRMNQAASASGPS